MTDEKDENVDISLGNLLTLADFYHVIQISQYPICISMMMQSKY